MAPTVRKLRRLKRFPEQFIAKISSVYIDTSTARVASAGLLPNRGVGGMLQAGAGKSAQKPTRQPKIRLPASKLNVKLIGRPVVLTPIQPTRDIAGRKC